MHICRMVADIALELGSGCSMSFDARRLHAGELTSRRWRLTVPANWTQLRQVVFSVVRHTDAAGVAGGVAEAAWKQLRTYIPLLYFVFIACCD